MTKEEKRLLREFLEDKITHNGDVGIVLYNDYYIQSMDSCDRNVLFPIKNIEKELEWYFGKKIKSFGKMLKSSHCRYNINDAYFMRNKDGEYVSSNNIVDLIQEIEDFDILLDKMVNLYEKDGDFTWKDKIIDTEFPAFKKKMKSKEKDVFTK